MHPPSSSWSLPPSPSLITSPCSSTFAPAATTNTRLAFALRIEERAPLLAYNTTSRLIVMGATSEYVPGPRDIEDTDALDTATNSSAALLTVVVEGATTATARRAAAIRLTLCPARVIKAVLVIGRAA